MRSAMGDALTEHRGDRGMTGAEVRSAMGDALREYNEKVTEAWRHYCYRTEMIESVYESTPRDERGLSLTGTENNHNGQA